VVLVIVAALAGAALGEFLPAHPGVQAKSTTTTTHQREAAHGRARR